MSHPKYPHIFYLIGDMHVYESACPKTYNIGEWIRDTMLIVQYL